MKKNNPRPNLLDNPKGVSTVVDAPVFKMLKAAAKEDHRTMKSLLRLIVMRWVDSEVKEGRLERVEGYKSPWE